MIKLVRLDYRLLHGQVVFSWTGHVGAQRIIVVDDDAANDEMKKSALKKEDRNISLLHEYALKLRVKNILTTYLETRL